MRLRKKDKKNYIKCLTEMKSVCRANGYLFKPKCVLSDFEPAQIKGCWIHYVQYLLRFAKRLGYQSRYENDMFFCLWFKQFATLALIPLENLEEAFAIILNSGESYLAD